MSSPGAVGLAKKCSPQGSVPSSWGRSPALSPIHRGRHPHGELTPGWCTNSGKIPLHHSKMICDLICLSAWTLNDVGKNPKFLEFLQKLALMKSITMMRYADFCLYLLDNFLLHWFQFPRSTESPVHPQGVSELRAGCSFSAFFYSFSLAEKLFPIKMCMFFSKEN